jgi:hypothetical protein
MTMMVMARNDQNMMSAVWKIKESKRERKLLYLGMLFFDLFFAF